MFASHGSVVERYEQDGHGGHGVCLGDDQTEAYLMDMGMTGLAPAWSMARRMRRRVAPAYAPIFDLIKHPQIIYTIDV